MKKNFKTAGVFSIVAIGCLMLSFFAYYLWARRGFHLWGGELMSLNKVCKRWREAPFSAEKFKSDGRYGPLRAQMACSLIKNQKQYIGMDSAEIRKLLGDYSGHYFNEAFPTYIIERAKERGQDSWQLVFLIDRQWRISRIVVHKNCCDP